MVLVGRLLALLGRVVKLKLNLNRVWGRNIWRSRKIFSILMFILLIRNLFGKKNLKKTKINSNLIDLFIYIYIIIYYFVINGVLGFGEIGRAHV
jgi:hypothetical protein